MPRVPTSTCRIQVRPGLRLADVAAIVPYLHALGVGDLYLSPIQRARPGSDHGYDGIDPTRLDPELGTDADLDALSRALRRRGMGLVVDIVPNHLAATFDNPWWRDLLAHGPASRRSAFFDVDWDGEPALLERVLLPFLGRPYGEALEAGELRLDVQDGRLVLVYYEHVFALDPGTWAVVLGDGAALRAEVGDGHPAVEALDDLLAGVADLPSRAQRGRAALGRRSRIARRLRERLAAAMAAHPALRAHVEAAIARLNGVPGDPRSFDALDALLLAQPWRPVFWRSGYERLNYRRFFQINELVGLRVEDERVFDAVHALPLRWLASGRITGLRIDHVDGLYDPTAYLRRLQERIRATTGTDGYVVVEKILTGEEQLPDEWPIAGTTGYELAVALNLVQVDPEGLAAIQERYARLESPSASWLDLVTRQKRRMLSRFFAPEVVALERLLRPLAALDRHARDLSSPALRRALVEVTAGLGVYRTYIRGFDISARDRAVIEQAVAAASRRGRADPRAIAFLGRALLLELPPGLDRGERKAWSRFVARWQQLSGPVMAKGVEDTAFYIYTPLVSLNEVGGDPILTGDPVARFHAFCLDRARRWPGTLNAVSTHDTKRSADVRARIAVLSELPYAWADALERWSAAVTARTGLEPPAYERSLLFQTLLGAWPLDPAEMSGFTDRIEAYLVKAAREAKLETSWLDPDPQAERQLVAFARAFLADLPEDFHELKQKVAFHGAINALAQTLVHLTAPGVPDVYQGDELWRFSLVDPDNRRPVDFDARRRLLEGLSGADPSELLAAWPDGRIKLHLVRTVLQLRREEPSLWAGAYHPVAVEGAHEASVLAYARSSPAGWALVVVPRRSSRVGETFPIGSSWGDTRLVVPDGAPGLWAERLTGREHVGQGTLALSDLLGALPIGLLTAAPSG